MHACVVRWLLLNHSAWRFRSVQCIHNVYLGWFLRDSRAELPRRGKENSLAFSCCLFCTCFEFSSSWPVAIQMQSLQPKFAYTKKADELKIGPGKEECFLFRCSTTMVITLKKIIFLEPDKNACALATWGTNRSHVHLCIFRVQLSAMISTVFIPSSLASHVFAGKLGELRLLGFTSVVNGR